MKQKTKLRIIGVNLILFAILYGIISFNKEILRPNINASSFLSVITGSLPNFIAAYIICLAVVNAVLSKNLKRGRFIIYSSSLLVFIILTIEELKPMWGASTYYDILDILASGLGSLFSILTFEIIFKFRKIKQ